MRSWTSRGTPEWSGDEDRYIGRRVLESGIVPGVPGDPETFPMAETTLLVYNSLPPDHSGTPRDVQDLIRDSEQHSVYGILIFIQP